MSADRPQPDPRRRGRVVARPVQPPAGRARPTSRRDPGDDRDRTERDDRLPTHSRHPAHTALWVALGGAGALVVIGVGFILVRFLTPNAPEPASAVGSDEPVAWTVPRSEQHRESVPTPLPDPVTPAPTPAKPNATARDLDAAGHAELTRAFQSNPIAARDHYARTRWRVRVNYVREFGVFVHTVVAHHVGQCELVMRDRDEIKAIDRNTPFSCEVIVKEWTPNSLSNAILEDATVVTPRAPAK